MSCSLTWHNKFYIFGGEKYKNQRSQVVGTELKRLDDLAFDHQQATCDVMGTEKIFLCFHNNKMKDKRRCRMGSDPLGEFNQTIYSTYAHSDADIAASDCK